MNKVPLKSFKLRQFADWIEANGGRLMSPTNPYEVLRYHLSGQTHVLYRKGSGRLTISDAIWDHYRIFQAGSPISTIQRLTGAARDEMVKTLLLRDGDTCCVCQQFLEDDITLEHWLAVDAGGSNDPRNLALAHEACNKLLGSHPLTRKVEIILQVRMAAADLPPWEKIDRSRLWRRRSNPGHAEQWRVTSKERSPQHWKVKSSRLESLPGQGPQSLYALPRNGSGSWAGTSPLNQAEITAH